MSDELKPVRCGCGGEAKVVKHEYYMCSPTYGVTCYKCGTATNQGFDTEAEAIEAWNTAMGTNTRKLLEVLVHDATDTNVGRKERTVKVVEHEYYIGTNLGIVGEPRNGHEYLCGACKKKVLSGDDYCSHCGAKLDWSE